MSQEAALLDGTFLAMYSIAFVAAGSAKRGSKRLTLDRSEYHPMPTSETRKANTQKYQMTVSAICPKGGNRGQCGPVEPVVCTGGTGGIDGGTGGTVNLLFEVKNRPCVTRCHQALVAHAPPPSPF